MNKNNTITFLKTIGGLALALAFVIVPSYAQAYDLTPISSTATLRVGSKGPNVRLLQGLMASNTNDMYPSKTVDGNFGPNTQKGVIQFQVAYDLVADGIAGPKTINKANSVILAGQGADISNAGIYNLSVSTSGKNEIISFNSSEATKSAIFYDTNLINWNNWDDAAMSLATPTISGISNVDNNFGLTKQFNLSNLSPNTNYNYVITTTDQSGNTSVTWPRTFLSAQ